MQRPQPGKLQDHLRPRRHRPTDRAGPEVPGRRAGRRLLADHVDVRRGALLEPGRQEDSGERGDVIGVRCSCVVCFLGGRREGGRERNEERETRFFGGAR